MSNSNNTIKTPIIDKNGKPTHVHKKADNGAAPSPRDIPAVLPTVSAPTQRLSGDEVKAVVLSEVPDAAVVFAVQVERDGKYELVLDYIDTANDEDESIFDVSPEVEAAVANSWSPDDSGAWQEWDDQDSWVLGLKEPVPDSGSRLSGVKDPKPLDVWFRFDSEDDEEPTYEANTYRKGNGYVIEWYHNDVGQVSEVELKTLDQVRAWYEQNGYSDYTP